MREILFILGLILMFGFIIYHFYFDITNYKNSYTLKMGGVFAEGMENQQNDSQTVTDQPIIVQEQQQEEQRKVMADNNNMASQPDMENDYASVENPRDFSIFNKDIMKKVLNSKHLIPGDINLAEESQSNYIRVGKSFIEEVSIIRNFSIPDIDETDYETLGRFVVKLKSENISESQKQVYTQKVLKDVYEMLASSSLSTSSVDGENEPIQSTTKRITGMFGDNSNSMMKKKLQLAGVPMDDAKFTDTYKPGKNETKKVQPYNSAWSIF